MTTGLRGGSTFEMQISKDFSSEVYTAGVKDGKHSAPYGGFGVFFGKGCPLNVCAPLPGKDICKERAELAAILGTLLVVKKEDDLNAERLWRSFNETVRLGIGMENRRARLREWIAAEFAHAPAERRKAAETEGTWELGLHADRWDEQCVVFDTVVEEMVDPVVIYSDSSFAFSALQEVVPLWNRNWKCYGEPPQHMDLLVPIAEVMKDRSFTEPRGTLWRGRVELEVVRDVKETEGALEASRLAQRGAELSGTDTSAKSHLDRLAKVNIVQAIEEAATIWNESKLKVVP